MNIDNWYQNLQTHVKNGEVEEALTCLDQQTQSRIFYRKNYLLHHGRWSDMTKTKRKGQYSPLEYEAAYSRFLEDLLNFAAQIASGKTPAENGATPQGSDKGGPKVVYNQQAKHITNIETNNGNIHINNS